MKVFGPGGWKSAKNRGNVQQSCVITRTKVLFLRPRPFCVCKSNGSSGALSPKVGDLDGSAHLPPLSRHDGFAIRRISRRSLDLITSKAIMARPSLSHPNDYDRLHPSCSAVRLAHTTRKKESKRSPPQPTIPAVRHDMVDLILRPLSQHCLYCRTQILEKHWRK